MMIESGTSQCPRLYNVILAGPQHREIGPNFQQAMEVGGPQHREFRKEIQPAMEVGVNKLIL
ncbi:hypothetical protein EKL28_01240 [Staphylococcus aureus]|nr:hypothetical protein EKL28_01240 [Staphylococcus aureus]